MSLTQGTRRALLRRAGKAWSVQFFEENDGIDFGSGANIDNLFSADCTIEFYGRFEGSNGFVLSKAAGGIGWSVRDRSDGDFRFAADFATTPIICNITGVQDKQWHHFALDFDVGTLTARWFADGILADTSTGAGAYQADAAEDCIVNGRSTVGNFDGYFSIGPIRLSNTRRYTGTSFDAPSRNNWPKNDANAQLLVPMDEGKGTTARDLSGNGYDGTITFGTNTRWVYS